MLTYILLIYKPRLQVFQRGNHLMQIPGERYKADRPVPGGPPHLGNTYFAGLSS